MRVLSIETPTHGRVLIEDAAGSFSGRVVVAFHGYSQSADEMLAEVRQIPGADRWRLISVQALHRFYTRRDQQVVASWMTRQDREHAIADNIAYVNRVVADVADDARVLVFAGFSQGVAMAYRAAICGRRAAAGIIALAGDIPPELKPAQGAESWPRVLIGAGSREEWYTAERVDADVAFLRDSGVTHEVVRFDGGHEWTSEFRAAAGDWLERVSG
jgi:predicted esterase